MFKLSSIMKNENIQYFQGKKLNRQGLRRNKQRNLYKEMYVELYQTPYPSTIRQLPTTVSRKNSFIF